MQKSKKQELDQKQGKDGYLFSTPFFLVAFFGIVVVSTALWFSLRGNLVESEPVEDVTVDGILDSDVARHPLSGYAVDADEQFKMFAVMVENSQDAWPLSGIEDSYLVYEAPVEGNITRFMAMYSDDQDVDEIGPVRSARPYYVNFAKGWKALYVHVGGSPESLDLIQEIGVWDYNEYFNGGSFWRSRSRYAPHNVYTSVSRLLKGWDSVVEEYPNYDERKFKDTEPDLVDRAEGHSVEVVFNGAGYDVEWRYVPETNSYVRYQAGSLYKMRSGSSIEVKNVTIMKTDTRVIDSVGRQAITTLGKGDATILIDGQSILGSWETSSEDSIVRFYDHDGDEIVWNVGKSWIEVVEKTKQPI